MRPASWAMVLACGLATTVAAQAVRQPSDWEKMYKDVSAQLRAAQDRKSELAADNAKLTSRVAQLQGQLDQQSRRFEQSVFLEAFYTGWESFTIQNPRVLDQWEAFWGQGLPLPPSDSALLFDPHWPLSVP
jgi:hypothetical protein